MCDHLEDKEILHFTTTIMRPIDATCPVLCKICKNSHVTGCVA